MDLVAKEYSDDEIDPKKYQAAILLWGPHYTGITSNGPPKFENSAGRVYSFCKEGRRAVIMFTGSVATSNEYLRPFGVAVVRNHDVLGKDVRSFDGSKICWLFNELTLGSYGNGKVDAYLQTNGSELEKTEFNGKTMSALMPVGQGDVLFLVQPSYNPGGWESPYGTLLYNKTLDQWDCKEAALRLLRFVKKM
ncbi:MAG TPA: hypothetical protein DDZ88_25090 [Verrucomicrobiales bacterium]|nr:hypothetical protein [Verrucomicrobiales bacterium]